MTPQPLPVDELRWRSDGRELWLLRLHRASRLPPTTFGIVVGVLVFAAVFSGSFYPGLPSHVADDFFTTGAFFAVSIGMICAIGPRVFAALIEDLERLFPVLSISEDERALYRSALLRLPPRLTALLVIGSIAMGVLHSWLLGQWDLPVLPALAPILGTVALWIAMMTTLTPLIMDARAVGPLGDHLRPGLLPPAAVAPFGAIALRPTLMIIGLQCAYPILVVEAGASLPLPTLIGIVAALASMTGMFFLPLRRVRRRLRDDRASSLTALDARIAALPLSRAGIAEDSDPAALQQLEQLLALRERIAGRPSWPLDVAGLRRVLLYVVLPPLTWAAAALVEILIDSLL